MLLLPGKISRMPGNVTEELGSPSSADMLAGSSVLKSRMRLSLIYQLRVTAFRRCELTLR